jgi:hypothetical protein
MSGTATAALVVGGAMVLWLLLRGPARDDEDDGLEELEPIENPRARLAPLERLDRDCDKATACYETKRDSRGRRRRCKETFRSKREALDALDEALDGMLYRYLEEADDGSELLLELEEHTEDRRGRRRRLATWWDAAAWAAPSSRHWRDFDPGRLAIISAALREHLPEALPLQLPRQTQRLEEADDQAADCKALARRPLEEAPF